MPVRRRFSMAVERNAQEIGLGGVCGHGVRWARPGPWRHESNRPVLCEHARLGVTVAGTAQAERPTGPAGASSPGSGQARYSPVTRSESRRHGGARCPGPDSSFRLGVSSSWDSNVQVGPGLLGLATGSEAAVAGPSHAAAVAVAGPPSGVDGMFTPDPAI